MIDTERLGVPSGVLMAMSCIFIVSLVIDILIAHFSVDPKDRLATVLWTPCQYIYQMMATFASCKALFELVWAPFYWDKTEHGREAALTRRPHGLRLPSVALHKH